MASTFGGYSIAVSGMYVNQASLAVTSHNLANISTSGYSRQRITGQETAVKQGSATTATGVNVQEVNRARNQLLDATFRQQNAQAGYWEAKGANLESAALVLNEFSADDGTSDNGLLQTMNDFFTSWEELAKDPASLSNRQSVIETAKALVETFQDIDSQLQALQWDAAEQVTEGVAQLNALASQVAKLNSQIASAEVSGAQASDLRDQRDTLLDSMSALAGINIQERSDGRVDVTVGGVSLVQGDKTNTLSVTGNGTTESPLVIAWSDLGQQARLDSGSILAYLEDADQSGVSDIDAASLPYAYSAASASSISNLRQGLNDLISTIATQMNSLHSVGTGIDAANTTGMDFFTVADSSKSLSIGNIQVNPLLEADTDYLAAGCSTDSGDNTNAAAIAQVADGNYFLFDGLSMDMSSFYQAIVAWVGTAGNNANSYYDNQVTLVNQVEAQRQSVASVSLDEEMSKMIQYQNAYSAAARVLSTMDGLLGDLITDLG